MKLHGVSEIQELTLLPYIVDPVTNGLKVLNYNLVWDPIGLAWVKETQPGGGSSISANQGTPNTLANGWPVKITDGTDVLGTPTHPVRTDPTGTTDQPVTNAGLTNLDVTLSTRLKPADILAGITTVSALTAIINALPAGSNLIGKTGIDQTTPGTTNKVSIGTDGTVGISSTVTVVQPTGTNLHAVVDGGNITVDGSVSLVPAISGGLSTFHLVSAATTNATNMKASAGQVYGWYIYNSSNQMRKVAFHDTAGTPTAGASIKFSLPIPPSSGANVFGIGIVFSSGIAITTVKNIADSDATAVALNDLVINIWYK